ncbi:MAG: hypothetical protein JWM11_2382 [Planctomycetaceae bacterium]|nr:hypothetical protein [Planctomycetaceae bacterium]
MAILGRNCQSQQPRPQGDIYPSVATLAAVLLCRRSIAVFIDPRFRAVTVREWFSKSNGTPLLHGRGSADCVNVSATTSMQQALGQFGTSPRHDDGVVFRPGITRISVPRFILFAATNESFSILIPAIKSLILNRAWFKWTGSSKQFSVPSLEGGFALNTFDDRTPDREYRPAAHARQQTRLHWTMLGLGLAIGILGMNLFVAQPLASRMQHVESELAAVQHGMQDLVGVKDGVWATSNLLSSLNAQHRQLAEATAAMKGIREFRQNVVSEAGQANDAIYALQQMVALQTKVLDQKSQIAEATQAMQSLAANNSRLIAQSPTNRAAEDSLKQLISIKDSAQAQAEGAIVAQRTLKDLISLKDQTLAQNETANDAKTALQGLIDLKTQVQQGTEKLTEAGKVLSGLVGLKDQVALHGETTMAAQLRADELLALRETLLTKGENIPTAAANLTSFVAMKDKLLSQTQEISDAIQNLEILADFGDEFQMRIKSLGELRQSLIEIGLLETTIARVSKALAPMAQLGNIRRLNDHELRDAARSILEHRQTRISQKPEIGSQVDLQKGLVPARVELPEIELPT